ncbi:MAG: hypothetical protein IJP70_04600 [Bacteroidales bacterium]|nr:hypothetical protein [Bacteroidales bacterium]
MKKIYFLFFFFFLYLSYIEAQIPKRVLWLGTSIPAGCTYPKVACEHMQMICINESVGASFLTLWTEEREFQEQSSGLSLTMSREEKEQAFRSYVNRGIISESTLDYWKNTSYESLILPYIKNADIVVIDHGYNDDYSLEKIYNTGKENIDWDSQDRKDFIGAFNYIYNLVLGEQPHALVIIGGYFQNRCTTGYFKVTIQRIIHSRYPRLEQSMNGSIRRLVVFFGSLHNG